MDLERQQFAPPRLGIKYDWELGVRGCLDPPLSNIDGTGPRPLVWIGLPSPLWMPPRPRSLPYPVAHPGDRCTRVMRRWPWRGAPRTLIGGSNVNATGPRPLVWIGLPLPLWLSGRSSCSPAATPPGTAVSSPPQPRVGRPPGYH